MSYFGLGMYESELTEAMRQALRTYYADSRGDEYSPGRAYAATNYENQIISAYLPRAQALYGSLSSVSPGTIAGDSGFRAMVDSFAVPYLRQQAQAQAQQPQQVQQVQRPAQSATPAPAGSGVFGRPLSQNEQYALAAGGGILMLGLLVLLTRK